MKGQEEERDTFRLRTKWWSCSDTDHRQVRGTQYRMTFQLMHPHHCENRAQTLACPAVRAGEPDEQRVWSPAPAPRVARVERYIENGEAGASAVNALK